MNKNTERLYNGLVKENPTFVLMLGMCPTLAVTTSAINGIGMGLSTTVVLVLSNMLKNPVLPSIFDGIGMGLGFTVGLTAIGIVRELVGSGKIFDYQILPDSYEPITIFILAPGAFFVLALLTALQNKVKKKAEAKGDPIAEKIGCGSGCATCGKKETCGGSMFMDVRPEPKKAGKNGNE